MRLSLRFSARNSHSVFHVTLIYSSDDAGWYWERRTDWAIGLKDDGSMWATADEAYDALSEGVEWQGGVLSGKNGSGGLHDFTAIDGVGPVTAQKLHDAGLFTYSDLRQYTGIVLRVVGMAMYHKIQRWLGERLC